MKKRSERMGMLVTLKVSVVVEMVVMAPTVVVVMVIVLMCWLLN